jgi:hypothetical protein
MSSFFNPANPRFRRGTVLLSTLSCSVVGLHILLADFGSQEHVFSPVQRAMLPKIDAFFNVTEEDIKNARDKPPAPISIIPRLVNHSKPK